MSHGAMYERIKRLDQLYLAWDKKQAEAEKATWEKKKVRLQAEADQLWAAYRDVRDNYKPEVPS